MARLCTRYARSVTKGRPLRAAHGWNNSQKKQWRGMVLAQCLQHFLLCQCPSLNRLTITIRSGFWAAPSIPHRYTSQTCTFINFVTPPVPPFEQWRYQYCECGNQVRNPSYEAKYDRWNYRTRCSSCEKFRHRYGFSSNDHVKKILGKPECAICGATDIDLLRVDHDHSTDRVRAWLCNGCNSGIGHLKEDPTLLAKAIVYCMRHRAMSTMAIICRDMGFSIDDHHVPARSDLKTTKKKTRKNNPVVLSDAGMHIGKN